MPSQTIAQHTPPPWHVEPAVPGEASGFHIFAADPNGSTQDGDVVTIADFIESETNARLIAAAPDLLAALKAADAGFNEIATVLRRAIEQGGERFHAGDMLKAVIQFTPPLTAAIAKAVQP